MAAALICLCSLASGQGYDPELQRAFLAGAQLFERGDYEGAAEVFRSLLRKTGAPRVKLELARSLFYLKQYREARQLFDEVLLDPGVPWQVRENVDVFLRQIENAVGYAKFSVSLVSDSNPRNITAAREFTIGGVRLTFQPSEADKKVTGLRYSVQAYKPLAPEEGVSAYASGSYLDFPGIGLDRFTVDGGVAKTFGEARRASVKAGIEAGTFGGKPLYEFPYLSPGYVFSSSPVHRIAGELKFGNVNFPYYGYLDARYQSVTLSGTRALSGSTMLSLMGALEDSKAREEPYSYRGTTVGPGATWLLSSPAVMLRAEASAGRRRYAAPDPLFGERRVDHRSRLELAVRSREWHWRGLHPTLSLSIEENRSTLDFYSYRKVNLAVSLE